MSIPSSELGKSILSVLVIAILDLLRTSIFQIQRRIQYARASGVCKKKEPIVFHVPNYTRLIIWLRINNTLRWKRLDVKLHAHNRHFRWVVSHFTAFCFLDHWWPWHLLGLNSSSLLLCVIWKLYLSTTIGTVYVIWVVVYGSIGNPMICGRTWH